MTLAAGANTAMLKYRRQHGRWPASNDQAGLAEPDGIHGVHVVSVSVGADGRISARFSGASPHMTLPTPRLPARP
ncbi:MAG: pilin [Rhodanobacter sp.]